MHVDWKNPNWMVKSTHKSNNILPEQILSQVKNGLQEFFEAIKSHVEQVYDQHLINSFPDNSCNTIKACRTNGGFNHLFLGTVTSMIVCVYPQKVMPY